MTPVTPTVTVAVVVVDHDGGDMTLDCLRHLAATRWSGPPLRVVLVDNSPTRPLTYAERATVGHPTEVLRPEHNIGFPGAVNLAIDHLGVGRAGGPAMVALVNNDAFVDPGWLEPLVAALTADPHVGAAQGKLLFEPRFAPVTLSAPLAAQPRGSALGIGVDAPPGAVPSMGFVAVRPGEWWTIDPEAELFVPADDPGATSTALTLSLIHI